MQSKDDGKRELCFTSSKKSTGQSKGKGSTCDTSTESLGQPRLRHGDVIQEILVCCGARPDVRLWRNETGFIRGITRSVRYGLVGSADILGITSDGHFFAVEVKIGKDRQSKQQQAFESMVKAMGGRYIVASTHTDVTAYLDGLRLPIVKF